MNPVLVQQVAARFSVPPLFVARVLTESPDQMRERYRADYSVPVNGEAPVTDYPNYMRYTPRMVDVGDPREAYIDYVEVLDPLDVTPSEPESGIRLHPTFARYVEWYKAGHLPPYPSVFEQIYDGERKLIGSNRRRILTAQEAGIRQLLVWLGRWNRETGLPLKYGDLIEATAMH